MLNREASQKSKASLARLSKAEAECAKEHRALTASYSDSPAWASASIAQVVRRCHNPVAAADAAATLANLTIGDEGSNAVVEAGAIVPLVALLRGGPESAAEQAVGALQNLAAGTSAPALLEEVARTQIDCSRWEDLREKLLACASKELQDAEAGSAVAALEHAITLAEAVQLDAAALDRAQTRLREINGDAERQKQCESFGLVSLALPDDFTCPITLAKMRGVPPPPFAARSARAPPPHACPACAADPVVASDGNSYERSEILKVFRGGNGRSPLTRERLKPNVLIPNRNLKRRMQGHEADVDDMLRVATAATSVANASDGAQQLGPAADGGEPSSEPVPKRSRPA